MTAPRPALGYPNRVDVIDVSEFQRGVDYNAVTAAGFRAAIVRVSWGTYVDVMATRHIAGFRAAGLLVGVYGALRPERRNPREQARALLDGMGDTYTRAFLDIETRGGLSNAELVDAAEQFCDEVDSFGALTCGFYDYPDHEKHLQPELAASSLGSRPLWQAYYGGAQPWVPAWGDVPHVPLPWHFATIWQYSGDTGYRVPGVPGACDRSLFMGDEAALRAFFGMPPLTPPPPTEPAPPEVA